jgi:hypothetical protein
VICFLERRTEIWNSWNYLIAESFKPCDDDCKHTFAASVVISVGGVHACGLLQGDSGMVCWGDYFMNMTNEAIAISGFDTGIAKVHPSRMLI